MRYVSGRCVNVFYQSSIIVVKSDAGSSPTLLHQCRLLNIPQIFMHHFSGPHIFCSVKMLNYYMFFVFFTTTLSIVQSSSIKHLQSLTYSCIRCLRLLHIDNLSCLKCKIFVNIEWTWSNCLPGDCLQHILLGTVWLSPNHLTIYKMVCWLEFDFCIFLNHFLWNTWNFMLGKFYLKKKKKMAKSVWHHQQLFSHILKPLKSHSFPILMLRLNFGRSSLPYSHA